MKTVEFKELYLLEYRKTASQLFQNSVAMYYVAL